MQGANTIRENTERPSVPVADSQPGQQMQGANTIREVSVTGLDVAKLLSARGKHCAEAMGVLAQPHAAAKPPIPHHSAVQPHWWVKTSTSQHIACRIKPTQHATTPWIPAAQVQDTPTTMPGWLGRRPHAGTVPILRCHPAYARRSQFPAAGTPSPLWNAVLEGLQSSYHGWCCQVRAASPSHSAVLMGASTTGCPLNAVASADEARDHDRSVFAEPLVALHVLAGIGAHPLGHAVALAGRLEAVAELPSE